MFQGFTELDHDMAKAGLNSPQLLDLDNDFVRLIYVHFQTRMTTTIKETLGQTNINTCGVSE